MRWVGLGLIALAVGFTAGCGGDAYESQFNASLQYLKANGQPLPRSTAAPSADAAADIEKLKGTWKAVSLQVDGVDRADAVQRGLVMVFSDNTVATVLADDAAGKKTNFYHLEPAKNPKEIDLTNSEGQAAGRGIYSFEGDLLKVCTSAAERPTSFATKQGDGLQLMTLKRAQGEKK
jgi:uncharacterized protein (TIGR03067 family)